MTEVIVMIAAVNVAALLVLVPLSFIGGTLALDALERLDLWLRKKEEMKPFTAPDTNTRPHTGH